MATFRKRDKKWQAIIRHKSIGTKARSFHSKAQAKLWATETEKSIEANTFNKLCPSSVTLGDLLRRYKAEITPEKRGKDNECRRIQRLLNDPVSLTSMDKLTSASCPVPRQAAVRRQKNNAVRPHHYQALH